MIPTLLNGAVLLDKPMGITSHDVVARLRYVLRTKRIGHTGTLDPFATGLLILCVGSSTRLSQFLTGKDKTYHATMRLGFATDTQDYTGKPLSEPNSTEVVTEDNLREAMRHYPGDYAQVPPMYSAKKVDGISLHRLARQGQV
ncbi:MAG TPA: tRNA pseudouridine(55) synthase TruB, partial [Acidobacteriota bacterium]|nr:tRNA pseudouridine(55) synthase TruB [Acidobacteriota bacterium]